MPATPHVVTYPGKVRIVDAGPRGDDGKRPRVEVTTVPDPRFKSKHTNGRFRSATVTRVTVPAGFRLEHDLQHPKPGRSLSGKPDKPVALVKVVPDGDPAPVVHAELEHVHEETVHTGADKTPHEGMTWTSRKLACVRATSLQHAGIVGEGSDAAAAVQDMNAKIAAKVKAEADAKAAARVERVGEPEALPAVLTPPHFAHLPGDEGDGETVTGDGAPEDAERVERKG